MYDSQKWLRNFDIVIIPNLFLSKCFWMYLHCLYIMYNIRIRIKPKENNWKLYPNRSKRSQICNRFGSGRIRFGWRFFSDRIYPWRTVLCSVHCAPHSSFKWADIDILLGIRSFSILMDACLRNAHPQNFWKIHLECNLYLCEAVPIESQFFLSRIRSFFRRRWSCSLSFEQFSRINLNILSCLPNSWYCKRSINLNIWGCWGNVLFSTEFIASKEDVVRMFKSKTESGFRSFCNHIWYNYI